MSNEMTAEKARLSVEEMISDKDDAILFTRKMDSLISAVRNEADERWRKAIAKEVQYQMYARSAIGESAVVALANVLEKMK